MTFLSTIIARNLEAGLKPVLITGKRLIRQFICPECKAIKMVKFTRPGGKARKSECTCGYIHYTKAWVYNKPLNKDFKTGPRKASTTL